MADNPPPAAPKGIHKRGAKSKRRSRRSKRDAPLPAAEPRATGGRSDDVSSSPAHTTRPVEAGTLASGPRASGRRRRGGRGRPRAPESPPIAAPQREDAPRPAPSALPHPATPYTGHTQAYAAIDLGTNNCRLLIARPSGDSFVVVDAFSRVVRLGEGLAQTGRLSDAAMDRALVALRVCGDKLRRRNVHLARSVATEACRRATNGPDFIARVKAETGIALDIISAREEARLAVLGCHILLEPGPGPALVFDIGGGSTELVLIENVVDGAVPVILDWVSIPYGVVSLTESCAAEVDSPIARAIRYAEMRALVANAFAAFADRIAPVRVAQVAEHGALRLLGTSGTVTTLASVHLDLPHYDRSAVDGCIVPAESMRGICTNLATLSLAGRREVACIGRERADLVVAGCAILESILDLWPAARLGVADRGIREGILRSLIGIHPPRPAMGET